MAEKALKLPTLGTGQSFCCDSGCGPTVPHIALFEYSREEDRAGNLIESKKRPIWVSSCCGSEVMVHDEKDGSWTSIEDVVGTQAA